MKCDINIMPLEVIWPFFFNSVSLSSSVVIPFEFLGNNEVVTSHIIFSSVFIHDVYIKVCCWSVLGCKSHWISASTTYHLSWPQIWKCAGVGHATSMPWCFWQQPCTYQVSRLWYVLWPCCYSYFICIRDVVSSVLRWAVLLGEWFLTLLWNGGSHSSNDIAAHR